MTKITIMLEGNKGGVHVNALRSQNELDELMKSAKEIGPNTLKLVSLVCRDRGGMRIFALPTQHDQVLNEEEMSLAILVGMGAS